MPILTMKDGRTYLIGWEFIERVAEERRQKARLRDLKEKAAKLKQSREAPCQPPTRHS